MTHPNADLMRKGYEAFGKGDMEVVNALFDDGITFHLGGKNQLTGDYKGKDAVFDFFSKLITITEGSFQQEIHDVLANDEHAIVMTRATARRGEKVLEDRNVDVWHVKNGKAMECWFFPEDQYAADAFYA